MRQEISTANGQIARGERKSVGDSVDITSESIVRPMFSDNRVYVSESGEEEEEIANTEWSEEDHKTFIAFADELDEAIGLIDEKYSRLRNRFVDQASIKNSSSGDPVPRGPIYNRSVESREGHASKSGKITKTSGSNDEEGDISGIYDYSRRPCISFIKYCCLAIERGSPADRRKAFGYISDIFGELSSVIDLLGKTSIQNVFDFDRDEVAGNRERWILTASVLRFALDSYRKISGYEDENCRSIQKVIEWAEIESDSMADTTAS